jgi:hypothetical protein
MGNHIVYQEAAAGLGKGIVDRGYALVYGGADVGLMKILAETVLELGGEVTGIMPRHLVEKEVAHTGLSHMHIVESMSERKSLMVKLSDMFIALPGGFGTLDELAEVITYNQLRLSDKPAGILNVNGFFDHLYRFFGHAASQGFLRKEHYENLIIESTIDELFRRLDDFRPVEMSKWIRDIKKESR